MKSHELVLAYIYRGMLDSSILESVLGTSINNTLYHEALLLWEWTLNRHFDIRLSGSVLIPGEVPKTLQDLHDRELRSGGLCRRGHRLPWANQIPRPVLM